MLKLKLQYFGHVMRTESLGKTLMLEKIKGITDSMDMSLSKVRELVMDREAWRAAVHGVGKSWLLVSNYTKLNLSFLPDLLTPLSLSRLFNIRFFFFNLPAFSSNISLSESLFLLPPLKSSVYSLQLFFAILGCCVFFIAC